jgi:anthranilate synthase/aminodeoxychorismate synthase-like glutamine amidotransferase
MLLLIDNYDSFTYNLYQHLAELGADVLVRRNDAISAEEAEALCPSHVVISPGPCTPREAGVSSAIVARLGPRVPLLGVCLGHQCIGEVFGGRVVRAPAPVHGKTAHISHGGVGILAGLPNPFQAIRYHSLIVERETLPTTLEVTAESGDGLIMGLRHREYPIAGVQFHPESILTVAGKDLLRNFLAWSAPPFSAREAGKGVRPFSASSVSSASSASPSPPVSSASACPLPAGEGPGVGVM